jgi:hypothetical protein
MRCLPELPLTALTLLFPLAVTIENARRATLLISYYLDFGKVATDVARGAAASLTAISRRANNSGPD